MANPVQNPSFEDPGVGLGQADSWTELYPTAAATAAGKACEEVCTFGQGTAGEDTPYEGFLGGWDDNELAQTGFGLADVVSAFFESMSHQREDFEYSWAAPETPNPPAPVWNHHAQFEYWHENFEEAMFDSGSEAYEDFNESWDDVEDAVADLAAATTSSASFDSGTPEGVEDFEEEWQSVESAVANLAAGATSAAMFDAGANAYENFEGTWPTLVYP